MSRVSNVSFSHFPFSIFANCIVDFAFRLFIFLAHIDSESAKCEIETLRDVSREFAVTMTSEVPIDAE